MRDFVMKVKELAKKWGIPALHTQEYPFNNHFWVQMLWPAILSLLLTGLYFAQDMLKITIFIIVINTLVYCLRTYSYWLQCEFLESSLPEIVEKLTNSSVVRVGVKNKIRLHRTFCKDRLTPLLKTYSQFEFTNMKDIQALLTQFIETGQENLHE